MTDQSISIVVLRRALDEKRSQLRALQADIEVLQGSIRQLGGASESPKTSSALMDGETAASLIDRQEVAVEDDQQYPADKFKGMAREEIAVVLARSFGGFISTGAFRKVLSKPGILRSTKQVGSVASRVLKGSTEFVRVWEGLYRLNS